MYDSTHTDTTANVSGLLLRSAYCNANLEWSMFILQLWDLEMWFTMIGTR